MIFNDEFLDLLESRDDLKSFVNDYLLYLNKTLHDHFEIVQEELKDVNVDHLYDLYQQTPNLFAKQETNQKTKYTYYKFLKEQNEFMNKFENENNYEYNELYERYFNNTQSTNYVIKSKNDYELNQKETKQKMLDFVLYSKYFNVLKNLKLNDPQFFNEIDKYFDNELSKLVSTTILKR